MTRSTPISECSPARRRITPAPACPSRCGGRTGCWCRSNGRAGDDEQLAALVLNEIDRAWNDGQPYSDVPQSRSRYILTRLPQRISRSKADVERTYLALLDSGRLRVDVPVFQETPARAAGGLADDELAEKNRNTHKVSRRKWRRSAAKFLKSLAKVRRRLRRRLARSGTSVEIIGEDWRRLANGAKMSPPYPPTPGTRALRRASGV